MNRLARLRARLHVRPDGGYALVSACAASKSSLAGGAAYAGLAEARSAMIANTLRAGAPQLKG
jgi:hypothetical protein